MILKRLSLKSKEIMDSKLKFGLIKFLDERLFHNYWFNFVIYNLVGEGDYLLPIIVFLSILENRV